MTDSTPPDSLPENTQPPKKVRFTDDNQPEPPPAIKELLDQAYNQDKKVKSILKALDDEAARHPEITLADCERRGNYLFYRDRLCIPNQDELKAETLRQYHEKPAAGHPGHSKTYELLSREYAGLKSTSTLTNGLKLPHLPPYYIVSRSPSRGTATAPNH